MTGPALSDGVLIGFDWGTTNVRAALLDASGEVLDQRRGDSGVGSFTKQQFEKRFDELTEGWPTLPAIAAGMVGSRQGWAEAGYLKCPTGLKSLGSNLTCVTYEGQNISIVPGLTCIHGSAEHDVMRGEETQIAGYLTRRPEFSGTLVLPGTHCKWAKVEKGEIVHFQTYLTGDLFNAISKNTILSHSIEPVDKEWDDNSFVAGFGDIIQGKGSDWGRLFPIRGNQLILGADTAANRRERLSGMLIGMEYAAARKDGFSHNSITLIGDDELVRLYKLGADHLQMKCEIQSATPLVWPALFALAQSAGLIEGANQ